VAAHRDDHSEMLYVSLTNDRQGRGSATVALSR